MTSELWALTAVVVLALGQLVASMVSPLGQPGYVAWTATNRDTPFELAGQGARFARVFRNFNETFVLFAAVVLILAVLHKSTFASAGGAWLYVCARLAYVPAYVAGSRLRTPIWTLSMLGLLACLVTIVI